MSAADEMHELASEALPRVSPELALVDPELAEGLRLRDQVLARRRPVPFQVLRGASEPDSASKFPKDDDGSPGAA